MRVLIIGSSGFVGRGVFSYISKKYEVYTADFSNPREGSFFINLMEKNTISKVLNGLSIDIIVNCSGVVENSDKANYNPSSVKNLLEVIVDDDIKLSRIITLGSAAEYGETGNGPVKENLSLKGVSKYALSKIKELEIVKDFVDKNNLPITVARLFNPIGPGMNHKQLIPSLVGQVQKIKSGSDNIIEVSRLDSKRDYVDVSDVARAIDCISGGNPKSLIYNIGSGISTSNKTIIELIIKESDLLQEPTIIETLKDSEPLYASQASIDLIRDEFGWEPVIGLDKTIKEIIHEAKIN